MSDDHQRDEAARVERIYRDRLPPAYGDRRGISPFRRLARRLSWRVWRLAYDFEATTRAAIDAMAIEPGDHVLVLCCGAGREFAQLRERVGESGAIVGVDFSGPLLERAQTGVKLAGWTNVHLVRADATRSPLDASRRFDAAVCLNGLSIIPRREEVFERLCDCVKGGGDVAVCDLATATGWRAVVNPIVGAMTKPYGGSRRAHAGMRALFERMERELDAPRTDARSWGTYRFAVGRVR